MFSCRSPSPSRARSPSPRRRMGFGRSRSRSPEKTLDESDISNRPLSPSRRFSPTKSMDMSMEIDPETVRSALRDFAQTIKDAERERDEAIARSNNLQKAVSELEEERAVMDQRMQALQKGLGEAEEGMNETVLAEIIALLTRPLQYCEP